MITLTALVPMVIDIKHYFWGVKEMLEVLVIESNVVSLIAL